MVRLETERLVLRPFRADDADALMVLAGDWAVASMTSDMPHPLDRPAATDWLKVARGEVRYAIEQGGQLIGGVGYFPRHSGAAELGFWIGQHYWRQGFATEAARALLRRGFVNGRFPSFTSSYFVDNPASGRVLAKLGFEPIGQGRMWSTARGSEVEAMGVWLTRERAEALLDIGPSPPAWPGPGHGRWIDRLSSVARNVIHSGPTRPTRLRD